MFFFRNVLCLNFFINDSTSNTAGGFYCFIFSCSRHHTILLLLPLFLRLLTREYVLLRGRVTMVLLHVKTADERNQFLFETTTKEKIKDVIAAVTKLHLTRLNALKLADAAEAVATYGPLRPEETRGLTEEVC